MRGVGVSDFRCLRRTALYSILLGPLLAGCSSSVVPSSMTSMFFSSTSARNANASTTGVATLPPNFECPDVSVRQGAATLTASSNPAEPTAMNLRYQVSIGTTARECRLEANNMLSIKVGMEGRVILGPEGSAGTIDVPIRYAVVEEGIEPKMIVTKLDRVAVAVPENDSNVLFRHVTEGLVFPMPRGGAVDSYVVYIGFDALTAQKPGPKAKPKPKKKTT